MTVGVNPEIDREVAVRRNAGWLTISALAVGLTNFLYALVLTWILAPREYSNFATAQALLLVCGTAAAASVPWLLTHRIAQEPVPDVLRRIVSFAAIVTALQGAAAGLAVGAITAGFAGPGPAGAAAVGAFAIFGSASVVGFLQGRQRFALVAILRVAEVMVKVAAGVALIRFGGGVAGVLAGFAAGSALVIALAGPVMLRHARLGARWLRERTLWSQTLGLAGIQAGVAVLTSLDLVMGSLFGRSPDALSSYQVSVLLSRVPFFLSTAICTAAFARLAAGPRDPRQTIQTAVDLSVLGILPAGVAIATLPLPVVGAFLPHQYPAAVVAFLPYTAPIALLASGTNLLTTFFQAEGRFRRCVLLLVVGIVVDGGLIRAGLGAGGIHGLAIGSLAGQLVAFLVILVESGRKWGGALVPRPVVLVPVLASLPLLLLREVPLVWLPFASIVSCAAGCAAFLGRPRRLSAAAAGLLRRQRAAPPAPVEDGVRPAVFLLTSQPLSPPWNGGDKNIARALLEADLGVDYAFIGASPDGERWPRHRRAALGFRTDIPTPREKLRVFAWLLGSSPQVDLVHAILTFQPGPLTEAALLSLPLLRHERLLITCPSGQHLPWTLLRRASAVVALSAGTERAMLAAGLPRVGRIAPGVDLDHFRPGSAVDAQRRLGLDPRPTLLFAGHYDPGGGLEGALDVLDRLRPRVPGLRLLIAMRRRPGAGDARRRHAIRERIGELGLDAGVVEVGARADMRSALLGSTAVLFQPRRLGMKMDLPLTLVEALACGRPVVVSPTGTLPELADGSAAVVVDEPAGERTLAHLVRLVEDPASAAACGAAARALAERRYSVGRMAASYREVYGAIIDGQASMPAAPRAACEPSGGRS